MAEVAFRGGVDGRWHEPFPRLSASETTSHLKVEAAIDAIARGRMIVVVDDEDREDEGDLIMAAELASPEDIAFFLHHTSGFICVAIAPERARQLELRPVVERNTERMGTAFLVSVDAVEGTSTGISACDRAATVRALADPATRPGDLARPGHVMPLQARAGGVLSRPGHTEASVDLARMAGLAPAGMLCEIVDGTKVGMARRPELQDFCRLHGLQLISIREIADYRIARERALRLTAAEPASGVRRSPACRAFVSDATGHTSIAVLHEWPAADGLTPLVAVQEQRHTGHGRFSMRFDQQLLLLQARPPSILVYVANNELSVPIDATSTGVAGALSRSVALTTAQVLRELGIAECRLAVGSAVSASQLAEFGIAAQTELVSDASEPSGSAREGARYVAAKVRSLCLDPDGRPTDLATLGERATGRTGRASR